VSGEASSALARCGSTSALLQLEYMEALACGLNLAILAALAWCRALVVAIEQQNNLLAVGVAEDAKQHLTVLACDHFAGLAAGVHRDVLGMTSGLASGC
jgi:hypothetical protein